MFEISYSKIQRIESFPQYTSEGKVKNPYDFWLPFEQE